MAFVTAPDGVRLHVETRGGDRPRPWLVFVHEFGGDATSWAAQVDAFGETHRCVTYNARGYPPSDVPVDPAAYSQARARDDLLAVLDGLAIERASLVGLSMGSFAALHATMARPERVERLVVAGIGYGSAPGEQDAFRAGAEDNAAFIEAEGMAAFADRYGLDAARVQLGRKDPAAGERQRARLAAHSAVGSANTLRGVQARRPSLFDFEAELRRLRVPVLVLGGDEDPLAIVTSRFLAETIPAAELVMLPATGHLINLEEPARFNELVGAFLAGDA
jgi:pimeloyl-ACP methyl ester carboxylesterase